MYRTDIYKTKQHRAVLIVEDTSTINVIDFKKAFDGLHRATLWKILHSYGVPAKFITQQGNSMNSLNAVTSWIMLSHLGPPSLE